MITTFRSSPTAVSALVRGLAAALATVLLAVSAGSVSALAEAAPAPAHDATGLWKVDPGITRMPGETAAVIVQAVSGAVDQARELVLSAGGVVLADLPMVEGFEAKVPTEALPRLGSDPAVRAVSANRTVLFEEYSYDDTSTASSFARTSGATAAWSKGLLGDGVGVAVIDTGVSPMNDFAGRLVHGPDLSGEGTVIDNYGHGTVMAGIVGGSGADSATRVGGAYTGVAPRSTIVAVKTAGRNGVVDVSTILQAMHWVTAHRAQFNIRVVNLSWGTRSTQHHTLDPLNYAVQRMWRSGIVVVVASGNAGPQAGTVTKPGDDPMVITVGAYDDKQNLEPGDDGLSSWSSRGPTSAGLRKPDIIAPGRSIVSPRAYGSTVEIEHPKALAAPSYIKGSGTSQAAAVVSGLVALMVQDRPSLTPDQVKHLLTKTALPLGSAKADEQGAGRVQLGAALTATPSLLAVPQATTATGLGSLEASRGGANVQTDCNGDGVMDMVVGEIDVRCEPWEPALWTASTWDTTAWMTDPWEVTGWEAAAWDGRAWTGGKWTGRAWTGRAWTGRAWTESLWAGRAWTGASWSTTSWTTGEYEDWTTAEYETEFLTAWWGPEPPPHFQALGELPDPPEHANNAVMTDGPGTPDVPAPAPPAPEQAAQPTPPTPPTTPAAPTSRLLTPTASGLTRLLTFIRQ